MSNSIMPADPGLVDHLVAHLISPLYLKDEVQLKKVCSGANFFPESEENVVLAVRIERWSSVLASDAQWEETIRHHFFVLSNILSEILNEKNNAVVAEVGYQMICVINLRQSYAAFCSDMENALLHMMEVLESEFDMSVTIAVSSSVQGLSELPRGYREITDAFWYNEYLGKDYQILFYEALCDSSHPVIHSELTELDKKLITKLQMMDIAGIKYVLHEMIDRELIEATPTVKVLNIRLGGICCKILDALDSLRAGIGDELYFQLNPAPRIAEAKNLVDMTAAMDEIFDVIARQQDSIHQEPKPQWVDRMSVYIDEHYTDENLGLSEVSAAFGITPSYATRVFKQYTGRGIYETIQHVRLSAAKALLFSDMTMKQIAQAVGYTSFLSMNRAFKKYEGTTPSRFKEQ
ncbi:MAG: helix-turn-helix domain-containing protein [Oscillospiraceae bacterium]|nr:helix-turn-helix domain-containing protein [Oscillospiraceae bacterium]